MTDCYIYTRVSTSKQVTEGNGLDSQLKRCLNYAKFNNFNVIKIYKEKGISGRTIYRPELEKLFLDLEQNKNNKIFLVDSLSRLSRDVNSNVIIVGKLTKLNARIISADMEIPDGIMGDFYMNIITAMHQYEAQSNQLRVFHRMHAQMENGRYVFKLPFGYERYKDEVLGKMIRPDGVKSIIVKEVLEMFASNQLETIADVQKYLALKLPTKKNNDTYRNKQAKRVLEQSALYAGLIIYKKQDKRLSEKNWNINAEGKHKPIISVETHQKIQLKLKSPKKQYKTKYKEEFPLSGILKCNGCNKNMTYNFSTSKSGKKIGYYRCLSYECSYKKKNINKILVESEFLEYLKSISFENNYAFIIEDVTKSILKEKNEKIKFEKIRLNNKINQTQESIINLIDKLSLEKYKHIHDDIALSLYEKKKEKLELEINLENLNKDNDLDKYLPQIVNIFRDLSLHWSSLNKKSQRSFNNLIFPQGISFTLEEKITTPLISKPFNVYSKDIKEEGNLVELRGLEPLTSTLPV